MEISGKVLDNNMRPIPFANIVEKGTSNATYADALGNFTINVSSSSSVLRFSHAAYDYDEIQAGDFNSYIELYPSSLDEVVLTADKKPNNTLAWVFGTIALLAVVYAARNSTKNQPRKVSI